MENIKDRAELHKKLVELAEAALKIDEPNTAITLYALSGAMHNLNDGAFASMCQEFAKKEIERITELRKAALN